VSKTPPGPVCLLCLLQPPEGRFPPPDKAGPSSQASLVLIAWAAPFLVGPGPSAPLPTLVSAIGIVHGEEGPPASLSAGTWLCLGITVAGGSAEAGLGFALFFRPLTLSSSLQIHETCSNSTLELEIASSVPCYSAFRLHTVPASSCTG
jgi:hypothetical protein